VSAELRDSLAEQVHAALIDRPDGMTRTQIQRLLRGNVPGERMEDALDQLAASGRARRERVRTGGWMAIGESDPFGGLVADENRPTIRPDVTVSENVAAGRPQTPTSPPARRHRRVMGSAARPRRRTKTPTGVRCRARPRPLSHKQGRELRPVRFLEELVWVEITGARNQTLAGLRVAPAHAAGLSDARLVLRRAVGSAGPRDRRYRHDMASDPSADRDERASAVPPQAPSEQEDLTIEMLDLPREECLRLLASHSFGRLAVSMGERAPFLRPVNYLFDETSQSVVFRTVVGSGFHALLRSAEATFEIDGIEDLARTGWSVIMSGVTDEVTNPNEISRLNGLDLDSWAPGHKAHWMRIRALTVSGRRIVLPPEEVLGYPA
jgi:nitroimidazol reductase NimA-like FMN-containing flavoprotein (pyridoxamine 5'-phosphate oxidase superfamily)